MATEPAAREAIYKKPQSPRLRCVPGVPTDDRHHHRERRTHYCRELPLALRRTMHHRPTARKGVAQCQKPPAGPVPTWTVILR